MHQALNVAEILRQILDYTDRATQAAASRTCHRWSDTALSSLWCRLDSISPVLQLYGKLVKGPKRRMQFEDSGTPIDGTRALSYTQRVLYLTYDGSKPGIRISRLHSSVFQWMESHGTGSPLLPSVRGVDWTASSLDDVLRMPLFLSDNTTSLDFFCEVEETRESSVLVALEALSIQPTKFTTFSYTSEIPVDISSQLCCQFFTTWIRLRSVTLPEGYLTQYQIFAPLAKLPELVEINFCWCTTIRRPSTTIPLTVLDPLSFPRLRHLGATLKLESWVSLMENPHRPPLLESLTIADGWMVQPRSLQHLALALPSAYPHLKSIILYLSTTTFVQANPISFDLFRPLLSCHAIEDFVVYHSQTLEFSEDDVKDMAQSWPKLRILGLAADPFTHSLDLTKENSSYESLQLLGSIFPELTELHVFVDARNFPSVPEKRILSNKITRVRVGTSEPPDNLLNFAMTFARIFPNATSVMYGHYAWSIGRDVVIEREEQKEYEETEEMWRDVEKYIMGFLESQSLVRSQLRKSNGQM